MEFRDIPLSDGSDGGQSWHSPGESGYEILFPGEIDGAAEPLRGPSASECSSEIDLESGDLETKVHSGNLQRDCRICQLELAGNGEAESVELGCNCKGDLGFAHKHCAETWFKIRGNTICEICGTAATSIAIDQINEANNVNAATTSSEPGANAAVVENQTCSQGRQVMNFVLSCMLIGLVVSWVFHFKWVS